MGGRVEPPSRGETRPIEDIFRAQLPVLWQ